MSYGQRSFFDRKTHQRQSVLVGRLTYPFYAAQLLQGSEAEELESQILDHLRQAQSAIELGIGKAEIARLAGTRLDQLDQRSSEALMEAIGRPDFETLDAALTMGSFPQDVRDQFSQALGAQALMRAFRELFLSVADRLWIDYLTQMEALRTSIGLEAYGQRDPLVQYKSRAFDLFQELLDTIRAGVVSRMFRLRVAGASQSATAQSIQASQAVQPAPATGNGGTANKSSGKRRRRRR
jgi:preprotein translocase subunit SecA